MPSLTNRAMQSLRPILRKLLLSRQCMVQHNGDEVLDFTMMWRYMIEYATAKAESGDDDDLHALCVILAQAAQQAACEEGYPIDLREHWEAPPERN